MMKIKLNFFHGSGMKHIYSITKLTYNYCILHINIFTIQCKNKLKKNKEKARRIKHKTLPKK